MWSWWQMFFLVDLPTVTPRRQSKLKKREQRWKPVSSCCNTTQSRGDLFLTISSFRIVTLTEIINEIKHLDESKTTQSNDIPTTVIKENYFLLLLLKILITWSKTVFSQIHLNKQILRQYTKKIPGMKRKATGL